VSQELCQEGFRGLKGIAAEVSLLVPLQVLDADEDFLLRPGPEAGQLHETVLQAGVFQLAQGLDRKLLVEGADLLRPQAGDAQHL